MTPFEARLEEQVKNILKRLDDGNEIMKTLSNDVSTLKEKSYTQEAHQKDCNSKWNEKKLEMIKASDDFLKEKDAPRIIKEVILQTKNETIDNQLKKLSLVNNIVTLLSSGIVSAIMYFLLNHK